MGKRGQELQAKVLDALRGVDGPLTAYEILDVLRASNPKIAPTTVYRTLSALIDRHLVHRLESLNAYVLCKCKDVGHEGAILSICDDCGMVEETVAPDLVATMSSVIGKSGFAPVRHVIEVHGICADCGPERTAT